MASTDDMSAETVETAYRARASEYVAKLGRIEHAAVPDLVLLQRWALGLRGAVIDVGCGPGQWTNYLSALGVGVEGIDPVTEFIDSARAAYPGLRYRAGSAEDLGVGDGLLGGVLAWYSLIHTEPSRIGDAFAEFARCLRPGGGLALGFFTGPALEPFDHAVTTAYFWPMDLLGSHVEAAGFTVTHTVTRTDPGARPHGAILATRAIRAGPCVRLHTN